MIFFEQVSKQFKQHIVLDEITLRVQEGEQIALIGANGAGKTTLMRCLLGEYFYHGKIAVRGLDPHLHRQTVLHHIGFVPQLPPPLKMPVGQLIHFAAGVCKVNSKNIIELIEKLGLDIQNFLSRPFVKLSGGQKQKILIAIALGRGSDILIMDEPTSALDRQVQKQIIELLLVTTVAVNQLLRRIGAARRTSGAAPRLCATARGGVQNPSAARARPAGRSATSRSTTPRSTPTGPRRWSGG